MNNMTRAAIYVRVSTEEQAKKGLSIEEQLEKLHKYADLMEWKVSGEFRDEGWSGKDDDRPELRRLMAAVQQKLVDVVVVTKLDRFMRNTRLLLQYVDELKKADVGFVAMGDNINTKDGKTGDLVLTVLAAIAQLERETISERIKSARKYRTDQGHWSMGRPLHGYRWNKEAKRFEVVEEEAKVIRLIFDWYVNGNMGMTKIAIKLNKDGYLASTGRPWSIDSVRWTLCHPAYANKAEHYSYPPIVDEATWQAAQKKRLSVKSVRRDPKGWLLQGMVVCALCGYSLACRQRDPAAKRKYVCRGRDTHKHVDGSEHCTLPTIDANSLENQVWSRFARAVSDSGVLRQTVDDAIAKLEARRGEMEASTQGISEQLKKVNSRIYNLVLAIGEAEGDLTEKGLASLKEKLEKLRKQKANLQVRKANLNPEAQSEVFRLEEYIDSVKQLLSKGAVFAQPDGIWAYALNEVGKIQLENAQCLGVDLDSEMEDTVERVIHPKQRTDVTTEHDGIIYFDIAVDEWAFDHPKEARIRSMRTILQKFNIRALAYPDRVEVEGMIPTEVIKLSEGDGRSRWGREFNSA